MRNSSDTKQKPAATTPQHHDFIRHKRDVCKQQGTGRSVTESKHTNDATDGAASLDLVAQHEGWKLTAGLLHGPGVHDLIPMLMLERWYGSTRYSNHHCDHCCYSTLDRIIVGRQHEIPSPFDIRRDCPLAFPVTQLAG